MHGSTGDVMGGSLTSAQVHDPAERDRLLATKLAVPRPRPAHLLRSRLNTRLDEGMACDLVLVCTPAGFGKTTLLADWARSAKRPVAWLSLDPDDNDPVRFWRYVVAALDRADVPVADGVRSLFTSAGEASIQGVVIALINELEALADESVMVLDDYHVIESTPIHDSVAFLLSHLPKQLHLVIACRSDPSLHLAALRAKGRLAELRADELRFSAEESAAFLRDVWGLNLSREAVAALEGKTEGWAVGLQLAGLTLQARPDHDAFLDAFAGTHRYVLDYLSEEVLDRQPERMRTFLLQTSVLERLSGPLCDAVTGNHDGQAMLETLEHANLFLTPLDEERRWYRFHHLFAELLRARLQKSDIASVPELHRRAADWCESNGLVDDAIRHALASGDAMRAALCAEQHLTEPLDSGEGLILERWLTLLPEDTVRSRPALSLAKALLQLHVGRPDAVERLVDHAERILEQGGEPRGLKVPTASGMVSEVPAAIALVRAELAGWRGDADRLTRFARSALAQMAEEEHRPRFYARWLVTFADWIRGHSEDAERGLAAMLAEGRAVSDPEPLMVSCFPLGRVQQARGKLGAALRTYREGLRFATEMGPLYLPFNAGEAHVGLAQVFYQRNRLDKALSHATGGIDLCRDVVEWSLPAVGLVALAWIRQAMGDADAAVDAMNEACRWHRNADVVSMHNPPPSERARLFLAQGRLDEAIRWTEERGLTEEDDVSYPHERDYLVLARVLLALSEVAHALELLERLDALAESQGRTGSVIEIRALKALALHAAGDDDGSLTVVAEALAMGRPEGYVRVFADEGLRMAALLNSLVRAQRRGRAPAPSGEAQAHLNRVMRAFAPAGPQATVAPAAAGLIEPLTARELEVLSFIAAGRRNREIADELVVTLETVKKHTSHIFDKLGATNRTEAVRRARDVGLIS